MTREFDLNIERVLENWTVAHALREVIANALDEQALTGTAEPQIFRDAEDRWHIRDWGRGRRFRPGRRCCQRRGIQQAQHSILSLRNRWHRCQA